MHDSVNQLEKFTRKTARRLLLRPSWPSQDLESLLDRDDLAGPTHREVLYLPALPLDFRWQRPQQLAVALTERGFRVVYLEIFERLLGQPKWRERWFGSRFCRLKVRVPGRPDAFRTRLNAEQTDAVCRALAACGADQADCALVQHPLWYPVSRRLASSGMRIVYDRIDWHPGFERSAATIEEDEHLLIELASSVLYSAPLLRPDMENAGQQLIHLPNAVEHGRFSVTLPPSQPVIGYIGALDHWFNIELFEQLARRRPKWKFRVAGMCERRDLRRRLRVLANTKLLGEIPYNDVPLFYSDCSVLLIPFRRGPIVDRVDPVKMYEAWAAGRPVVAPPMPSLMNWRRPLLYTYDGFEAAEEGLVDALAEDSDEARRQRAEIAAEHTWDHRAAVLEAVLDTPVSQSGTTSGL